MTANYIFAQLVKAGLVIWSWLSTWFTPFWIVAYVIASVVPIILTIYSKRHLKGTPELNKKYNAFARLDYPHWSYVRISLMALATLMPIRWIIGLGVVIIYITVAFFAMLGADPKKPLSKWRINIMLAFRFVLSPIHYMMCGILSIKKVEVKYDYSKYLGKDWKPTYGASGL